MLLRGVVFSGSLRGAPLIEKYSARLIGIIGFRPYPGTLDIELDKPLELAAYATKRIEHVRPWGAGTQIDAHLAPATIRKKATSYKVMEMRDKEKEIVDNLNKISSNEIAEGYPCWAVQFTGELLDTHVIEILAKDELRKTLDLKDEDAVEIVINDQKVTNKKQR